MRVITKTPNIWWVQYYHSWIKRKEIYLPITKNRKESSAYSVSLLKTTRVKPNSNPSSLSDGNHVIWLQSKVSTLFFSVCLFFNHPASPRVQQWNKMSSSGAESTSMCWLAGSILMLPSTLHWTKGPLCALASQRCTPSSKKTCPKYKTNSSILARGAWTKSMVQDEELPVSEVTNKTWWIRRKTEERRFFIWAEKAPRSRLPLIPLLRVPSHDGCANVHVSLWKHVAVSICKDDQSPISYLQSPRVNIFCYETLKFSYCLIGRQRLSRIVATNHLFLL